LSSLHFPYTTLFRSIRGATLADDAVDDFVQVTDGAAPRWRQEVRKVKREEESLAGIRHEPVGYNLHGFADTFGDAGDLRSKQALCDDLERHAHHVLVNVA